MQTALTIEEPLQAKLCKDNNKFVNASVYFYTGMDGKITLSCNYPGFFDLRDIITLDLWKEFENTESLALSLEISHPNELEKIKPYYLLSLFEKGVIDLSCYVEKEGIGHRFFFTKRENSLYIVEELTGDEYKVRSNLVRSWDYINYAKAFAFGNEST